MDIHEGVGATMGRLETDVDGKPVRVDMGPVPKRRDQVVWPLRVDDELVAGVDGLVARMQASAERRRAAVMARGLGPGEELEDVPSRHTVLLELLRRGLREATRSRGDRAARRAASRGGR